MKGAGEAGGAPEASGKTEPAGQHGITARVPAKLNLQLAVGPPRADGYHDLVTVFHAVSLFDRVTVEPAGRDAVTVTGEGAGRVPADGDNLALRAVAALRAAVRDSGTGTPGVRVTIAKKIPVAAGLAGGSADAAAALVACNELWAAGLTQQQLCEVGATVGSDVAFALLGGTAVGRGRGEQLTPALVPATQWYCVAGASADVSRSPRPRPTAVPPSSAKATSLPTRAATSSSCGWPRRPFQSSLQARRAAAASPLPPARPAATGIRLAIVMCTPGAAGTAARNAPTARSARLSRSAGTRSAPSPLTVTPSRPAGSAVISSNSETAWNTVTRSW